MQINRIINGNCLDGIRTLPEGSIDCVITSPPYWQLRDYGWDGQWGLEPTFHLYLEHLWSLMDEVHRVLKDTGTVWINLGDTYGAGGKKSQWDKYDRTGKKESKVIDRTASSMAGVGNHAPNKSLLLIPHRFAIGCMDRGWIVRNDIVWARPNGMPESVRDRFSKKHEYFFLMVKQGKYYFDLDAVRDKHVEQDRRGNKRVKYLIKAKGQSHAPSENAGYLGQTEKGKNPGNVAAFWEESDIWPIPTKPSKKNHYATYNKQLIDKPIKAGCPPGGIILDPFAGTGTTLIRAWELDRKFIGIEGSKEYVRGFEKEFLRRKRIGLQKKLF